MSYTGGCNCGAVRITLEGEPSRVGVCHCQTCRRETGSAFMAFAAWNQNQLTVTGETRSWAADVEHRHFCPVCGSALFSVSSDVEVRLGCLDAAPSGLAPTYELWVGRREAWQHPVTDAAQHQGNRPG